MGRLILLGLLLTGCAAASGAPTPPPAYVYTSATVPAINLAVVLEELGDVEVISVAASAATIDELNVTACPVCVAPPDDPDFECPPCVTSRAGWRWTGITYLIVWREGG